MELKQKLLIKKYKILAKNFGNNFAIKEFVFFFSKKKNVFS